MNIDLTMALFLLVFFLGMIAVFVTRIIIKGSPKYDRLNDQGSKLMSKKVMEMGYWGMQPCAKMLVFFGMTPNQISWISLGFGFLAGFVIAFGHFGFACLFMIISSFLDSLDGMVARITGLASEAGEVLDSAMDRYVEYFFLGGLIIYYREALPFMILTMLALLGSYMVSYSSSIARGEQIELPRAKWSMKRPERLIYLTLGAGFSPMTIPWLERVRDYPVPIGHPMVIALGVVAIFANVFAIEQFRTTMKIIRQNEAIQKMQKQATEENANRDLSVHI